MKFLTVDDIIIIHDQILKVTTGLPGLCPDKSLESALERIEFSIFYEGISDIFDIAALYAFALAQGHVFNDANKRTALIATYDFLEINGYDLDALVDETTEIMVAIANKELTSDVMAAWLKFHSNPILTSS